MTQLGSIGLIRLSNAPQHLSTPNHFTCTLTVTPEGGVPREVRDVIVLKQRTQKEQFAVSSQFRDPISLLSSGPVDMAHTAPTDIPHRWGQAYPAEETEFELHSTVHAVKPAITKTGEIALLNHDGGVLSLPLGKRMEDFVTTEAELPCQYIPQDGGTLVRADMDLLITPAVTGCKVFMANAGGNLLAFHINQGGAAGDFQALRQFKGVAHNILEQYGDFERLQAFVCIESLFDEMRAIYPQLEEQAIETMEGKLAAILALPDNLQRFCGIFTDYSATVTKLSSDGKGDGRTPFAAEIMTAFIRTGPSWNLAQFPMLRNRIPEHHTDPRVLSISGSTSLTPLNPPDFLETLIELAGQRPVAPVPPPGALRV